jgi:DNA polymerase I-like protein with 3'-5' exonuclease and polymerase domains
MRLVFDLEANGLYWDASRIHCLVAVDKDTKDVYKFEPSKVEQGLRFLMEADEVIGHNIIGYDLALAKKLYPWFRIERERVCDTLILSRLIYSDLSDQDRSSVASLEPKLIGSHSLKAWGQRLGFHKADYEGGWDQYSEEMLEYNVRDTEVTDRLHELLVNHKAFSERASILEHQVAHIVAQQERAGFAFDSEAAEKLSALLLKRRAEIEAELQDVFPPYEVKEEFIPKANNKSRGYVKGVPTFKTQTVVFNPGSRRQIADRLIQRHGWKPLEFTPDGSAKIDESVLSKLEWPEAKLLTEYLMVQKRLGMLAEGDNAWIKMVRNGRIHGEVITNGAVTGRATHRNPNIAQVPAVGAPYGKECRSLFTTSSGRRLVGIDVSGLELRCLAHFMSRHDNGKYGKEVVEGDVHTVNQQAAGLETRNQAKTFIYAFLYGAGPEKIGSIVGKGKKAGAALKERFLERTPAIAKLIRDVRGASERGYLIGLDGRRLHIRSSHAALNTLLQSAGALICKQWMVEVDQMITHMEWSDRVQQVAWVHDECQFECDPEIAEEFGQKAVECISKAGDFFKFKLPLTGEYKIGNNWAETH